MEHASCAYPHSLRLRNDLPFILHLHKRCEETHLPCFTPSVRGCLSICQFFEELSFILFLGLTTLSAFDSVPQLLPRIEAIDLNVYDYATCEASRFAQYWP